MKTRETQIEKLENLEIKLKSWKIEKLNLNFKTRKNEGTKKMKNWRKNSSQISCGNVIYATGFYFIEVIRKPKSQKNDDFSDKWALFGCTSEGSSVEEITFDEFLCCILVVFRNHHKIVLWKTHLKHVHGMFLDL